MRSTSAISILLTVLSCGPASLLAQGSGAITAAPKTLLKCSSEPAVSFSRVLTVPGGFAAAGVATECDAGPNKTCPKPADLYALAVSSKGESKPACPMWIGGSLGLFGIDDSDRFKSDSIVVGLRNNGRPLAVKIAADDPSGRKERTQLVSGNFTDIEGK